MLNPNGAASSPRETQPERDPVERPAHPNGNSARPPADTPVPLPRRPPSREAARGGREFDFAQAGSTVDLDGLPSYVALACRSGQHAQARSVLRELLDTTLLEREERSFIVNHLARVEASAGNVSESLRLYRAVAEDSTLPDDLRDCAAAGVREAHQVLFEEGEMAYWRMNYAKARKCFEQLLREPGIGRASQEALRFNLELLDRVEGDYRIILEDLRMLEPETPGE
ncbi:MAG: hypothetical protein KA419_09770 [Acidobacteria bacterium]|nr:hypothetical protein [Acidobacteriota bacterium]